MAKGKVKVNNLYSALSWTHLQGAQVWHSFSMDLSFTCTPRVHPLTEWTILAFAFPAEAGTHLLTPEGWKTELAKAVQVIWHTHKSNLKHASN